MNSNVHKHIPIAGSEGQAALAAVLPAQGAIGITSLGRVKLTLITSIKPVKSPPPTSNDPSDVLIDECLSEMRDMIMRLQTYQTLRKNRAKAPR